VKPSLAFGVDLDSRTNDAGGKIEKEGRGNDGRDLGDLQLKGEKTEFVILFGKSLIRHLYKKLFLPH